MFNKVEVRLLTAMVGLANAFVTVTTEDGEPKFDVGLTPGVHPLTGLAEFMEPTDILSFQGDATPVIKAGTRLRTPKLVGVLQTGANADWKPSSVETMMKAMEAKIMKVSQKADNAEKRAKAADEALKKSEKRKVEEEAASALIEKQKEDELKKPNPDDK